MDTDRWVQRDFFAFEEEVSCTSEKSFSYRQHLLRDNGEHLDINSVELVQTGPGALLAESTEESANKAPDRSS